MITKSKISIILLAVLLLLPTTVFGYKASDDFNWIPSFLSLKIQKPAVTIFMERSLTLYKRAYPDTFEPQREYYGYFDPYSYYEYSSNGYFKINNTSGEWNGNFMNWLVMNKMAIAQKVLTGGKYDTENGCFIVSTAKIELNISNLTYDNNSKIKDLNRTFNYMAPSKYKIVTGLKIDSGGILSIPTTLDSTNPRLVLKVQGIKDETKSVLYDYKDKARMALAIIHDVKPSETWNKRVNIFPTMGYNNYQDIVDKINNLGDSFHDSRLAEALHTVQGYIRQFGPVNWTAQPPLYTYDSYYPSNNADPYYINPLKQPCIKQSIILITGGDSNIDNDSQLYDYVYGTIKDIVSKNVPGRDYIKDYGLESRYIIDVAYLGQQKDVRSDLDGDQHIDLIVVAINLSKQATNMFQDAARYGKFKDTNKNNLPDLKSEYDVDGNGVPDNYFAADSGSEVEEALRNAFDLATAGGQSGNPGSLASQSRTGEGGSYQALLFPPGATDPVAPAWAGQVHALFVDAYGNLREDTPTANQKLDLTHDKIVRFENSLVYLDSDSNGDGTANVKASTPQDSNIDLNFIWDSTTWLNALPDPTIQRTYASADSKRYIFTFADNSDNPHYMVPDEGEVQDFILSSPPSSTDIKSKSQFYSYLTLKETTSGSLETPTIDAAALTLAKNQVDYIRGKEISGTRSRTFNGTVWRLGDVISSTPTVVGKPAEGYHLIFKDKSYQKFVNKYANRRQVVYVGANDGMLHAFNGGFFNSTDTSFSTTAPGAVAYPLGMELWAYVPFNLLPHLKWLMDPAYGEALHVAYMDGEPRVFDARVFTDDGENGVHPGGWGTVLVAGMRLGGATIQVNVDKDTGNNSDYTARSAYVIMDITNPESPPTLLGEITMPGQGFTTCQPTVMPMSDPTAENVFDAKNAWFLAFGSGPADATGAPDRSMLPNTAQLVSNQNGKLYLLDLYALVQNKTVSIVNSTGGQTSVTSATNATNAAFATLEANSFVSDPVAVDLDITSTDATGKFSTDVLYYGTVAGNATAATGKMYRLKTDDLPPSSSMWETSTLINVGQPISVPPTPVLDDHERLWLYFGAGRFLSLPDANDQRIMSFYGIHEPEINGVKTWATVTPDNLYNSTLIDIYGTDCPEGEYSPTCVTVKKSGTILDGGWTALMEEVEAKQGWRHDLRASYSDSFNLGRVLGQALAYDQGVFFTSYAPSTDECSPTGKSYFWGLYYKTGTAYYNPILSTAGMNEADPFPTYKNLGSGMAVAPSLHLGKSGSNVLGQSSTGSVYRTPVGSPAGDSGNPVLFWRVQ